MRHCLQQQLHYCRWVVVCLVMAVLTRIDPAYAATEERTVMVFNTYQVPPFLINDTQGIAPLLVRFLNAQLQGRYRFVLQNLPRERLRVGYLSQGRSFNGVVILLAPTFVDDADMTRYLWTRPLFADYNVLAFRRSDALVVRSLQDLKGKTFAMVRGNRYAGLDEMVDTGQLRVEITSSELSNLHMVAVRRADFTQMSSLSFLYLSARQELQGTGLMAIPRPDSPVFQRRIMVGRGDPLLFGRINAALAQLPCDSAWQRLQKDIGFEDTSCKEARKSFR